ncbi:hypothetical protein Thini_0713 [Thiothrix nivea DSM 5205]|uniref:Uncharacterized protein n=1 Tax=Thiothrix nivea (strain ATCC 35100 / DSM 5205 / JP2) TaxID=870187 RepID=A0A656HD15_THINJ|nr:hypothetical protein Thini_0713 [Thiothrix nivea DSM 5205]
MRAQDKWLFQFIMTLIAIIATFWMGAKLTHNLIATSCNERGRAVINDIPHTCQPQQGYKWTT